MKITLLSPAKDKHTALEAIRHGADAVYIGAERFGARVAAGNAVDDIAEVCQSAHEYGVEVYVTLNTILYDSELEEVEHLVWQLHEVGVDALIVQDMAFLKMHLPPIRLHASTQMDNRTPDKVAWLHQLGFEQAVLARELTLDEIREIHRRVPGVQLEAFVHGSICVSYNGQCYASQHCFGRSANRGACAQFCRLPFDLETADGRVLQEQRHLLSLHDMNRSEQLEEMLDAGVSCLKIEGRLKDVGYVKNVTAYYRQALDAIIRRRPDDFQRASFGHETFLFEPQLERSFNRGFTDYFLHGRNKNLIQPLTPKSMGQMVGTVKEVRRDSFNVAGVCSFANGDGLCFVDADGQLQGFRVNRVEGNRLYPHEMPRGLRPRMRLYRNFDQAFERLLSRPTAERRIHVWWRMQEETDGLLLTLRTEDGREASRLFPLPAEQARTPQRANIERQLSRLGDTPYASQGVEVATRSEWFIPSSTLAEWRREVVELLPAIKPEPVSVEPATDKVALKEAFAGKLTADGTLNYQANVSNHLAEALYREMGAQRVDPAYEVAQPGEGVLMTTRYCLRHELGMCLKQSHNGASEAGRERGPQQGSHSGPLFLRLADGRRFGLKFDCKRCLMHVLSCLCVVLMLTSCYYPNQRTDAWDVPEEMQDSLDFVAKHHYSEGYNFVVWSDSIRLMTEIPQLAQALVDSPDYVTVCEHDPLVVADVYVDTTDAVDSVWIKVARDQLTQGWLHERELLPQVVPDDPISIAIMLFSNGHLQWTLVFIFLALGVFLLRRSRQCPLRMVHYRDISSPYPTLLCLLLSGAAVLYASIQEFAPQLWADYYYHPTLNPFALQPVLGAFVASVWMLLIFAVAVVDDVTRQLHVTDAVIYLYSLLTLMAVEYVVFSISTLYVVGYGLYAIYVVWALWHYFRHFHARYRCGHCGIPVHSLGRCPKCGGELG